MYGDKRKKAGAKDEQFEVANIASGVFCTFDDDGVGKEGQSGQARLAAKAKLNARDEDGDPLFVPVFPLPKHVSDKDKKEGGQKFSSFPRLTGPSNSKKFETLQQKFDANKKLREDWQASMKTRGQGAFKSPLSDAQESVNKVSQKAKDNKAALGAKR